MTPPRYTTYELKLEGDAAETIAFLKDRLPASYPTIAEANGKRRAIRELFGDKVEAKVVSVRRVPARTVRRVLRV